MTEKMFQVPAEISRVQTMSDGGLRLFVDTQELNQDDKAKVMSLHRKLGWFIMKEAPVEPEDMDVPEYVKEFKQDKTPSQRMRSVLYLLWQKEGESGVFDDFYKRKMEEVIEYFKKKLD